MAIQVEVPTALLKQDSSWQLHTYSVHRLQVQRRLDSCLPVVRGMNKLSWRCATDFFKIISAVREPALAKNSDCVETSETSQIARKSADRPRRVQMRVMDGYNMSNVVQTGMHSSLEADSW